MTTTDKGEVCLEVEERLSEILDGSAPDSLFDHVAECDACRDLRHEARMATERVGDAGRDYRAHDHVVDRLRERLEAASPVATKGPVLASEGVRSSASGKELPVAAAVNPPVVDAPAVEPTVSPTVAAVPAMEPSVTRTVAEALALVGIAGATQSADAACALPVAEGSEVGGSPTTTVAANGSKALRAPLRHAAPLSRNDLVRHPAVLLGAAAAIVAAASLSLYLGNRLRPSSTTSVAVEPWSGSVASVARASADGTGNGLTSCTKAGRCAPAHGGDEVRAGSILRTDARTRARIALKDGTELSLERNSEVELSADRDRSARVSKGTLVADVAHVEGSSAQFALPRGEVEVVGTRLSITAADDRASVEVARGIVRVRGVTGRPVEVRAGEEAVLVGSAEPVVAGVRTLSREMDWSDDNGADGATEAVLRGLGELRARRPGQTNEKDRAVRLSKHAAKIRIVDLVARTEVDETFTNETGEELEGIYRFPLPSDAQIERLALEVDGKLVEGAFVDRDKGAAIWRGVIQNAAPKAPKPREEIVWVPGPWRDPALLEWQRGGRFELKIFPIPRHGSRRVVLTYTQVVDQTAGLRRFTYPLALDESGKTKVASFDLDVQVIGADRSVGLLTRGYELAAPSGDGTRRTLHAENFVPAGDLTVEYALPDRDKDLSAWAYAASPAPVPTVATQPLKPSTPEQRAAEATAVGMLDDSSPYALLALRPRLPRTREGRDHLHVLVVDASRSMVGERYARAGRLASSIVREMDRRDSFLVLACDTTCRTMGGEPGADGRPQAPGSASAASVDRFLGSIEPDGGSDLAGAFFAARNAAKPFTGKDLRIVYLGDGTPSVGPTRAGHLELAVRTALPAGAGSVVAVALGTDADTASLSAVARGGGGVVVPYVPGQRTSSTALDVLSAAYGDVLRDPEIELPAGFVQVSPSRLDPIRGGSEVLVAARMAHGDVSGTVKLKGFVGGERFEQTYPLKVAATASAGNAFVSRLYAAARIAEIERAGSNAEKGTAIELSKRFAVASRYTSLLVLESEAMFKAFGLDRPASGSAFTGEDRAESSHADADGIPKDDKALPPEPAGRPVSAAAPVSLPEEASGAQGGAVARREKGAMADGPASDALRGPAPAAAPPPAPAPGAGMATKSEWERPKPSAAWRPAPPPPRSVPMRKVYDRKIAFEVGNAFLAENGPKISAAAGLLSGAPDSRDKTIDLYGLYATTGRLGEAQTLASRWSSRDALDPDALVARADLSGRKGDRDRAIRILGGLADVRPNDRGIQTRLADLQEAAGNLELACEHRIALADLAASDGKLVAAAVRCARAVGLIELANALRLDATDKVREAIDKALALPETTTQTNAGDVQITAEWSGGEDLDLALIDGRARRTSWIGAPSKVTVTARDVKSVHTESLRIAGLTQGNYVLEVSRTTPVEHSSPVRGEVTLRLAGSVRKVPFTLVGDRVEVGTVRVYFTSHLEPLDAWTSRPAFPRW